MVTIGVFGSNAATSPRVRNLSIFRVLFTCIGLLVGCVLAVGSERLALDWVAGARLKKDVNGFITPVDLMFTKNAPIKIISPLKSNLYFKKPAN